MIWMMANRFMLSSGLAADAGLPLLALLVVEGDFDIIFLDKTFLDWNVRFDPIADQKPVQLNVTCSGERHRPSQGRPPQQHVAQGASWMVNFGSRLGQQHSSTVVAAKQRDVKLVVHTVCRTSVTDALQMQRGMRTQMVSGARQHICSSSGSGLPRCLPAWISTWVHHSHGHSSNDGDEGQHHQGVRLLTQEQGGQGN
jgi:hypothetical protein